MTRRAEATIAALAVAVVLGLTGCGGGARAVETEPEADWPDAAVWGDAAAGSGSESGSGSGSGSGSKEF